MHKHTSILNTTVIEYPNLNKSFIGLKVTIAMPYNFNVYIKYMNNLPFLLSSRACLLRFISFGSTDGNHNVICNPNGIVKDIFKNL